MNETTDDYRLDLDYILKSIDEKDRAKIAEEISNNKVEVKFELWLYRPNGTKGDGIGKKLKEKAFGEKGALEGIGIIEEWPQESLGAIKDKDVYKYVPIKVGYSTTHN